MLYSFIVRNVRRFVRVESALPSLVVRTIRNAGGQDIRAAHNFESGLFLDATASGYDTAARTEESRTIPQDESNARQREQAAREPVTREQIESAFARLLA